MEWSDHGVEGSHKFLNRLWSAGYKINTLSDQQDNINEQDEKKLKIITNKTIAKITADYGERVSLNTVVSSCMEMLNAINKSIQLETVGKEVIFESYKVLILLLNPITPHICKELASELNILDLDKDKSWPEIDHNFIKDDVILMIIQVNGKVRKKIEVSADILQEELEVEALESAEIIKHVGDRSIKKIIYIKGKLVNIVTS